MKKTSKKAYVGIVCICALVAALVFGGKAILIRYAAKNSSLDGLQAAEKFDGRYYDKENNLYLTFSEKDEEFLMTDGSTVYHVSFRRGGFSGDLFVMISDESGEGEAFTGSAKIDKDGSVIKIECDSKKYNKLNFTKKKLRFVMKCSLSIYLFSLTYIAMAVMSSRCLPSLRSHAELTINSASSRGECFVSQSFISC